AVRGCAPLPAKLQPTEHGCPGSAVAHCRNLLSLRGKNSRATFMPARTPMLTPNDVAPSPIEVVLCGCQAREINAAPAAPPIAEMEMEREPLSCRARKALSSAYPSRPMPRFPDSK